MRECDSRRLCPEQCNSGGNRWTSPRRDVLKDSVTRCQEKFGDYRGGTCGSLKVVPSTGTCERRCEPGRRFEQHDGIEDEPSPAFKSRCCKIAHWKQCEKVTRKLLKILKLKEIMRIVPCVETLRAKATKHAELLPRYRDVMIQLYSLLRINTLEAVVPTVRRLLANFC
ncbi:hypothetical protein CBR_g30568 [Chara braunii]|uniref:Uncharacterized protein n=1 Tax=Chara braunii TaxID=69332 RepID=A0A388LDB5_CHABU|nr:hypothetical protein CBR_g30568 [Chara braunii]|eukprot:GBG80202.1 hypothetical protein CBR_g30568 [Chara braunii]